jgi:hypothetical protein
MKAFVGTFWATAGLLPGVSLSQRETQFRIEAFARIAAIRHVLSVAPAGRGRLLIDAVEGYCGSGAELSRARLDVLD